MIQYLRKRIRLKALSCLEAFQKRYLEYVAPVLVMDLCSIFAQEKIVDRSLIQSSDSYQGDSYVEEESKELIPEYKEDPSSNAIAPLSTIQDRTRASRTRITK